VEPLGVGTLLAPTTGVGVRLGDAESMTVFAVVSFIRTASYAAFLITAMSPTGILTTAASSTVFTIADESAAVKMPLLEPSGATTDGTIIEGLGRSAMTSSKTCRPIGRGPSIIEDMLRSNHNRFYNGRSSSDDTSLSSAMTCACFSLPSLGAKQNSYTHAVNDTVAMIADSITTLDIGKGANLTTGGSTTLVASDNRPRDHHTTRLVAPLH
jgi:hypothetical protein